MRALTLLLFLIIGSLLQAQTEDHFRIAMLGCHRQFQPAPALVKYLMAEPDLCLWVGDNIYIDTEDDPAYMDSCYAALAAKPAFRSLKRAVPYLATWDDHDYGNNNESSHYSLKADSKEKFRTFWGLEAEIPADQEGIFYGKFLQIQGKQVQILMLDVRYHRDEPGSDADMLGEAQWAWLGEQLRQPADLRLIVSGTQVLLDKASGSETWDQYPRARARLFDLIRRSEAEGVVFLTGDQHYGEVCRLTGALDYDAVELQFSGINQTETPEFNPLRVASAATARHSYALIDLQLQPSETDVPHLLFRIYDAMTDVLELSYRVNLAELQLQVAFDADTAFAGDKQVHLQQRYPDLELRYTTDGSEPTVSAPVYDDPFRINQSTVVRARLFDRSGFPRSRTYTQAYERLAPVAAVDFRPGTAGLQYEYVEGDFQDLPDFEALSPRASGIAKSVSLAGIPVREDHFALRFRGYFQAPEAGVYTFYLSSDDGARLLLHNRLIVDNGGSHSRRTRQGRLALAAGFHPIEVLYFEDYAGQSLRLEVQVPGEEAPRPADPFLFVSP